MITDKFIHIHIPRTGGTSFGAFAQTLGQQGYLKIMSNIGHNSYKNMCDICKKKGFNIPLFIIAFIRNPWDWQVSRWSQMVYWKLFVGSFEDFVRMTQDETDIGQYLRISHCWKALGGDNANFVGRYERYNEDVISAITQAIPNLDEETALSYLLSIPRQRVTKHADYHTYYTEELKCIVYDMEKEIIDKWGYEFSAAESFGGNRGNSNCTDRL